MPSSSHKSNAARNHQQPGKTGKFVFVKSEYKIIKVKFEDILFCEGLKDYTQIYIKGKSDPILTALQPKRFSFKTSC